MHHDHDHGPHHHEHSHHHHHHDHHPRNGDRPAPAGLGHNQQATCGAAQWQTPHLDPAYAHPQEHGEPDLDQVEAAFIEGFMGASDPTSFLRLARIPFEIEAGDGARLVLLRVETHVVADIGSLTPHLGGGSFRYDPLPQSLVSRRRRLRFVYFDGATPRSLTFANVRDRPHDAIVPGM